jgi:hypothetical protein
MDFLCEYKEIVLYFKLKMDLEIETQYDYDHDRYMKLFVNIQTLYFITSMLFVLLVIYSARNRNISGQNRMRREYV